MWHNTLPAITFLVLAATAVQVEDDSQGFVDEDSDAVVIEAYRGVKSARTGRQFMWSSGSTTFGSYPASTIPLMPVAQTGNYLCLTPGGSMRLCGRQFGGGWPGAGAVQQPGAGWPGAGGQPGGWPGVGGGWPGAGGPPPQGGGPPPQGGGPPPQGFPGAGQRPPSEAPSTEKPAPPQGPPGPGSNYPKTCGVGKYPIRYNENGTVAEEQERIDNKHQHPFRVVNGWPADEGEWPWIAALLQNGRQFCGGSLISKKHILTAAHCVAHMSRQDVAALTVRLGEYNIKQSGETKIFETAAARVVRHKEFTQQTLHKDVAIITLDQEVPEMDNVRAVCLPASGSSELYAGQTGTVVGWGSIRERGPQPDILREVTVRIWDNPTCKDTYGNAAPGGIMDHMMCAGQKGKDSCSGDSGGPMSIGTGTSWTQIGIVSWGIGCGKSHYPGVYTRVTAVKSWIDKIVSSY